MKEYFFTIRIKINALRVVIFIMLMLGIMGVAYVAKVQYKRIAKYNEIVRGNESRLQMLPKPLDVSAFRFEKPKNVNIQDVSFDLPKDLAYSINDRNMMGMAYTTIDATSLTLLLNTPRPVNGKKGVRYAFGSYDEKLEPYLTTPARTSSLLFMDKHLYSRNISNIRHKASFDYNALFTFDTRQSRGLILNLHDGCGIHLYVWFNEIEFGQFITITSKNKIDIQFVGAFLNSLTYRKVTNY